MSFPHSDEILKFRETFMEWAKEGGEMAPDFAKMATFMANMYVFGCRREAEIAMGIGVKPAPVPKPVETVPASPPIETKNI